jgi:hypothetical protein
MRPPGFAEAARQSGVVSLEKYQRSRSLPPQPFEQRRNLRERLSLANVDHQRRAPHVSRTLGQLGELGDQLDGQVVDSVVAQILKGLENGGLARPAQAGDDDQFGGLRIRRPGGVFGH